MELLSKTDKWHKIYMETAEIISSASHANRRKVGAIIVKDNRIISFGYNGTPSGFDNDCEINNITKPEVLHAESNAIAKCAKSNESTNGSAMYITLAPCFECSKLIIQCGITDLYYRYDYKDQNGIKLLKQHKKLSKIHTF
jgi:dCMP deaminase